MSVQECMDRISQLDRANKRLQDELKLIAVLYERLRDENRALSERVESTAADLMDMHAVADEQDQTINQLETTVRQQNAIIFQLSQEVNRYRNPLRDRTGQENVVPGLPRRMMASVESVAAVESIVPPAF